MQQSRQLSFAANSCCKSVSASSNPHCSWRQVSPGGVTLLLNSNTEGQQFQTLKHECVTDHAKPTRTERGPPPPIASAFGLLRRTGFYLLGYVLIPFAIVLLAPWFRGSLGARYTLCVLSLTDAPTSASHSGVIIPQQNCLCKNKRPHFAKWGAVSKPPPSGSWAPQLAFEHL
jgi:hypothetical protein